MKNDKQRYLEVWIYKPDKTLYDTKDEITEYLGGKEKFREELKAKRIVHVKVPEPTDMYFWR